jgi:P27 family predicted phage terminase small subunit
VSVKIPPPPDGLNADGKRVWRQVCTIYDLSPPEQRVLEAACLAWAQMKAASRAVEEYGVVVLDRYGSPKANPAVALERDARLAFVRCLRELRLEPPAEDARPPRIGSRT